MVHPSWEGDFRLGDACEIKHGFPFRGKFMTTEDDPSLPIVVNIVNFKYTGGFRFESTKVQRYKGDFSNEYMLSPGQVLVVMTCQTPNGEILGIPGQIPDDGNTYLHNQRMGLVEITNPEKLDLGFVYYLFLSPEFNRHLFATATGAKILHTAPSRIENYRFTRPPLTVQRRIAEFLSAFDLLIENNLERMRILEATTQSLYRKWFVHFRFPGCDKKMTLKESYPFGWTLSKIKAFAETRRGKPYRSRNLVEEGGIPFLTLKCVDRDGGLRVDGLKWFSGEYEAKYVTQAGDLLIALTDMTQERRVVGRAARVPDIGYKKFVFSMDLLKLIPLDDLDKEFLYGLCRYSPMPLELKEFANGVNVLHLSPKHVRRYEFLVPPSELRKRYAEIVSPIYNQIDILTEENILLAESRSMLLPRLISGQVEGVM